MKTLLFVMFFGMGNLVPIQTNSSDECVVNAPAETAIGSYLLLSSNKTWVKGSIYTVPAEGGGVVLTKYDFPGAGRGEFPANTHFTNVSTSSKVFTQKGYNKQVNISGLGVAYTKM